MLLVSGYVALSWLFQPVQAHGMNLAHCCSSILQLYLACAGSEMTVRASHAASTATVFEPMACWTSLLKMCAHASDIFMWSQSSTMLYTGPGVPSHGAR